MRDDQRHTQLQQRRRGDGTGDDVAGAYKVIRSELGLYNEKLLDKKEIVGIIEKARLKALEAL